MARKDSIFKSFLEHEILLEKYGLTEQDRQVNLAQGLESDVPIIKSIAMIVDALEGGAKSLSDSALRNMITQYLNSAAI